MSLLDQGTEIITLFPSEIVVDDDGNTRRRPSAVGLVSRGSVQPVSVGEDQEFGSTTNQTYRLRLVRAAPELDAGSAIEWRTHRFDVDGPPRILTGSKHTSHLEYRIVRN